MTDVITIEHRTNGPQELHRFKCTVCGRFGVWLNHEHQAARNGGIHAEQHNAGRDSRVTDEDLELAQAALAAPRQEGT